jgi:energy-coupling factor transport system ATP-binding protein
LTIVIVTHDVSLVANYTDRVIVVREGSVVLDGRPDEVFRQATELESCQVTPPQVAALAQAIDPSMFTCRVGEMLERLVSA